METAPDRPLPGRDGALRLPPLTHGEDEDGGMDVEWGPESPWGSGPRLDEFLLARIAEDERLAAADDVRSAASLQPDGHASPFDPARVLAECAAKRHIVLSCREVRPDTRILGA